MKRPFFSVSIFGLIALAGALTSAFGLPHSDPLTFSSIAAGKTHTCALASNGVAYCWGAGNVGQLGHGQTANSTIPVAVSPPSGEPALTFSSVSAGAGHTCGVASNGAAYCWGNGNSGQLGNGDTADSSVPVAVNITSIKP
jgi:alpha-tubulin suppressor-like RCC1 family protein